MITSLNYIIVLTNAFYRVNQQKTNRYNADDKNTTWRDDTEKDITILKNYI